jgi:hypothetical protein
MIQGLVFRDWCGFVGTMGSLARRTTEPAAAVAGVAAPDGVAPALARPRGRGPGRSRTLPAGSAGVVGPPPARAPPAAVACNGSAAARGAEVDSQIPGSSGTEKSSD